MLKHYIAYAKQGKTHIDEVDHRNPNLIDLKPNIRWFRFYDQQEIEIDGRIIKGKKFNFSKKFYRGKTYPYLKELETKVETYVEFLDYCQKPLSIQQIDHRNFDKIQIPIGASYFFFFDREVGMLDGNLIKGAQKNKSRLYSRYDVYKK